MIKLPYCFFHIGSALLLVLLSLTQVAEATPRCYGMEPVWQNMPFRVISAFDETKGNTVYADTSANESTPKLAANTADSVEIIPGNRFFLEPNAPNPFTRTTVIGYSLDVETNVVLKVYDFFYNEIAILVDEVQPAGRYEVVFDPEGKIASGMYFYELTTARGTEIRRMMFIR